MTKMHDDLRTVGAKRDQRYFRQRVDMHDGPILQGLNNAGRRMGIASRADASDALREYIETKKCAIAASFAPCLTVTAGYVTYRRARP